MKIKKNILFILPWLPYPLKSGGHQAIFNGIKAVIDEYNVFITYIKQESKDDSSEQAKLLSTFNNKITILPYEKKQSKEKPSLPLRCYIKFLNVKEQIKKILHFSKKTFDPCFFKIDINDSKGIHFINDLIRTYHIDMVQCEMIPCISNVLILPTEVKKIYVQHQIDYIRCKLDLQQQNLFSKFKEEFYQCVQTEIFLLNRFDSIIALSEHDKNIMEHDGVSVPIYVSPAIVSTKPHSFNNASKRKILSFVGPSSHPPNVEGIQWFLKNCWNNLKKKDNEYELQIIGEWDNSLKKEISQKFANIHFYGFVPNLESLVKNSIMIVPINIGSGIRMKILEAVSLGIPVVSTTIGAQGLPLENNIDCFITDDANTFIMDILKLRNIEIQKQMVQNAQDKIINSYSFTKLKKTRLDIYSQIR